MKFKAAYKYQLNGMKKSLIIFYIVIYAVLILMTFGQISLNRHGVRSSMGGIEMASVIFLFVTGLSSFKSTFHMFLANGVSRQTMFKSFSTMILPVAAGMALIDTINNVIFSSLVNYKSMFFQMYSNHYEGVASSTAGQVLVDGFLWMFFCYATIAMLGFFITAIFYRMNKPVKLIVSIGIPVLLVIVLPFVDANLCDGRLFAAFGTFFAMAWGFLDGFNPYIFMISSTITFAVFGGLSFLVMKKATFKQS